MNKIWVIGLGPGHLDYLLPIGLKKLQAADVVIGGKRHLQALDVLGEKLVLKIPLSETIDFIKNEYSKKQIAVLVSGDTGFYSFLDTLKREFDDKALEVYPGISSLQYMFSKLNKTYQHALISSVHGRTFDLEKMFDYKCVGLLTDRSKNPKYIYNFIKERHVQARIYVGENLSYEDEKIRTYHTGQTMPDDFSSLCVVVIEFE